MHTSFKRIACASLLFTSINTAFAEDKKDDVQDMSDPLAVYTQAGLGYTDKGFNVKIGKSYDSGKANVMAMNLIEIKGIYGDAIGTRDNLEDSIDKVRFRNFSVDGTSGLGSQIDVEFNLHAKTGSAAYSLIQALPKWGPLQLYPLAGVGLAIANNVNNHALWGDANSPSGYSFPGAYGVAGMYGSLTVTDKIWINYNPVWLHSLGGSDAYKDNTYGKGESSVLSHEVALSYQISPVFNVRYFGNWSNLTDFNKGDQRIEVNYQL